MQKLVLSFILSSILITAPSQTSFHATTPKNFLPKETTIYYKLGERVIQVKTFQYGNSKDMVYINLHDDEITAINGAKKILEKKGGYLIKIENYRTRNIKFKLDGKYYTIDPNRMFSREGIAKSLILFGNTSPKAIDAIEKFANRILQLIPPKPSWVIALHNNTNGKYSINSYLPSGEKGKDAKALNVNDELDADDFFLTTDSILFDRLADQKYNTIWQDNERAKKDGSLSVYCGEKNIHYINCETEHGRQPEYDEMIAAAVGRIEGKVPATTTVYNNQNIITYNYKIVSMSGRASPKSNSDILFGDKKVGLIRSVLDSSWAIFGKLEMSKEFAIYSNMDFFLIFSTTDPARIEVRIDPTRKKELINPFTSVITITAKAIN